MNDDGFLDNPLAKQINVLNRWQYQCRKGWVSFINFRYMNDQKKREIILIQIKIREQLIIGAPKSILNVWMFPLKWDMFFGYAYQSIFSECFQ
jgi:hypothetical protein